MVKVKGRGPYTSDLGGSHFDWLVCFLAGTGLPLSQLLSPFFTQTMWQCVGELKV